MYLLMLAQSVALSPMEMLNDIDALDAELAHSRHNVDLGLQERGDEDERLAARFDQSQLAYESQSLSRWLQDVSFSYSFTDVPTQMPSPLPSLLPNPIPSQMPSKLPSQLPSPPPTPVPSSSPSLVPTSLPTQGEEAKVRQFVETVCNGGIGHRFQRYLCDLVEPRFG